MFPRLFDINVLYRKGFRTLIKISTVIAHIVPRLAHCDTMYKNRNKVATMKFCNPSKKKKNDTKKWQHAIKPSDNAKLRMSFICVFNCPSNNKRIIVKALNKIPNNAIVHSIKVK
jgi:hypothetical protein